MHTHTTTITATAATTITTNKTTTTNISRALNTHLSDNGVDYLQFAFRWMNCLLMRELPLRCSIRLWDTYNAQTDGFAEFHM